jgi:hypothetical protein
MTDEHDDLELLARLRAGDPAASLPPADPHRVARLLEDIMRETTDTPETTAPRPRPAAGDGARGDLRHRGPLTWLVAAAAVVLIAGAAFALIRRGTGPADTPVAVAPTSRSTTHLTLPPARAGARCPVVDAALLRGRQLAVDARVRDIAGDRVTLVPRRFYAGRRTDLVVVRAAGSDPTGLDGAVDFRAGERYLVSANDGQVSVCGLSAPWSQHLAGLYAEAFGS